MPRKPTAAARLARERIVLMTRKSGAALPPVRELAESLGLHASTIFRIFRDLAAEGMVWQNAAGRFYPAAAREQQVRGLPVYFVGRQMWNWSRLYQEILDGVSEICAANGSPLILMSSPSLVRQTDPALPPVFAPARVQKRELAALLPSIPGRCGGIILDHLWGASALSQLQSLTVPRLQLLHEADPEIPVVGPDIAWIARHTRENLIREGIGTVDLVVPFRGDQAIDAAAAMLRCELAGGLSFREVPFAELHGNLPALPPGADGGRRCLVCVEDNTAAILLEQLRALGPAGRHLTLFGVQGTGVLAAPAQRLRMDYRRLGRAAASRLLHGVPVPRLRPALVSPHDQC